MKEKMSSLESIDRDDFIKELKWKNDEELVKSLKDVNIIEDLVKSELLLEEITYRIVNKQIKKFKPIIIRNDYSFKYNGYTEIFPKTIKKYSPALFFTIGVIVLLDLPLI